jgi:hypothetical protein
MAAFKVPFVGADLDGMGLGEAFRRFVLEDPDLLACFRGSDAKTQARLDEAFELIVRKYWWPLSRSQLAHEGLREKGAGAILDHLCNAFGDLFRSGECVAEGHPCADDGTPGQRTDINRGTWKQEHSYLSDLTGEIFDRPLVGEAKFVLRWTGILVRCERPQERHSSARPDAYVDLSDDRLKELHKRTAIAPHEIKAFVAPARPWYDRSAAERFAADHGLSSDGLRSVHHAVCWAWVGDGMGGIIPPVGKSATREGLIRVALMRLGLPDYGRTVINDYRKKMKKIRAAESRAVKRRAAVSDRSRS